MEFVCAIWNSNASVFVEFVETVTFVAVAVYCVY